jgi:hypothetical protein
MCDDDIIPQAGFVGGPLQVYGRKLAFGWGNQYQCTALGQWQAGFSMLVTLEPGQLRTTEIPCRLL